MQTFIKESEYQISSLSRITFSDEKNTDWSLWLYNRPVSRMRCCSCVISIKTQRMQTFIEIGRESIRNMQFISGWQSRSCVRKLVFCILKNIWGWRIRLAYVDETCPSCTIQAIRGRMNFIPAVSGLVFSRSASLLLAVTDYYITLYVMEFCMSSIPPHSGQSPFTKRLSSEKKPRKSSVYSRPCW